MQFGPFRQSAVIRATCLPHVGLTPGGPSGGDVSQIRSISPVGSGLRLRLKDFRSVSKPDDPMNAQTLRHLERLCKSVARTMPGYGVGKRRKQQCFTISRNRRSKYARCARSSSSTRPSSEVRGTAAPFIDRQRLCRPFENPLQAEKRSRSHAVFRSCR